MTIKPSYKRVILSVAAVTLALTGLMGFAHTRAGRPVLVYLGKLMGKHEVCPLGFDQAESLGQREERRRSEAARNAHLPVAKSKLALTFVLGSSTRAQVEDWARSNNGLCRALKSNYQIECEGAFFGSSTTTLWLEFDARDVIVGVHGISKYIEPAPALNMYAQARKAMRAQARAGYAESGETPGQVATGGLLAQATVLAKFSNLNSTARLTRLGDGFAVTQDFSTF